MNHIKRSDYKTEQDYWKAKVEFFESQNKELVKGLTKRVIDMPKFIIHHKTKNHANN